MPMNAAGVYAAETKLPEAKAEQDSSSGEHTSTGSTGLTAEVQSSEVTLSDGYVALLMFQNDELTRRVEAIETKLSKHAGESTANDSGSPRECDNELQTLFSVAMEDLVNFQRQVDVQIKQSVQRQDAELQKLADAVQKVTSEVNMIRSDNLLKVALKNHVGDHVKGTANDSYEGRDALPRASEFATSISGQHYRLLDAESVQGTIDECEARLLEVQGRLSARRSRPLQIQETLTPSDSSVCPHAAQDSAIQKEVDQMIDRNLSGPSLFGQNTKNHQSRSMFEQDSVDCDAALLDQMIAECGVSLGPFRTIAESGDGQPTHIHAGAPQRTFEPPIRGVQSGPLPPTTVPQQSQGQTYSESGNVLRRPSSTSFGQTSPRQREVTRSPQMISEIVAAMEKNWTSETGGQQINIQCRPNVHTRIPHLSPRPIHPGVAPLSPVNAVIRRSSC